MANVFKRWSDSVDAGRKSALEVCLIFTMISVVAILSMLTEIRLGATEFEIITMGVLGLLGLFYAITVKRHGLERVGEDVKDWIGDMILLLLLTNLIGLLYLTVILDDSEIKKHLIKRLTIGSSLSVPAIAIMLYRRIRWIQHVLHAQKSDQN